MLPKFFTLMPAANVAASIRSKAIALERAIDSARRGHNVDPKPIARELAQMIKEVTRAVA